MKITYYASVLASRGHSWFNGRAVRQSIARLEKQNRLTRRKVTGSVPAVVSLTTYGRRFEQVHIAIESIARSRHRPERVVLWVNEEIQAQRPTPQLTRLLERGLEIRLTEDLGPHKKYFPALVDMISDERRTLVTADDDVIYPRYWLRRLANAVSRNPNAVWCYRAKRMTLATPPASNEPAIGPYAAWQPVATGRPSITHVATGVSGVAYSHIVRKVLLAAGDAFRTSSPRADDLWLHRVESDAGIKVGQVSWISLHFPELPGSQIESLTTSNVGGGDNDRYIAVLYDASRIGRLAAAAGSERSNILGILR